MWDLSHHGFTLLSVSEKLRGLLLEEVVKSIRQIVAHPADQSLEQSVKRLNDEDFRFRFRKVMRFFSAESVKALELELLDELPTEIRSGSLSLSLISPKELSSRPESLNTLSKDFFWRCVRPNKMDVGKPHADFQFWDIARGTNAAPFKSVDYSARWKIWIPLYGCTSTNSLQMLPFSHRERADCFGIYKDYQGELKPYIKDDYLELNKSKFLCPIADFACQAILFNDRTIHQAMVNQSEKLRISAELTLLQEI